uniref:RING-type E3 ubiquitin transferase n=1 Tax=Phallusia mammillata TaxID=59560 RepID=A0A6F9DRL4_9ASCI|nr:E3 ubiquitin-protein ligase RFWD3 [Phallusia mammillata]
MSESDLDPDDILFPSTAPDFGSTVAPGHRLEYVLSRSSDEDEPGFQISFADHAARTADFSIRSRNFNAGQAVTTDESSNDSTAVSTLLEVAEAVPDRSPVLHRTHAQNDEMMSRLSQIRSHLQLVRNSQPQVVDRSESASSTTSNGSLASSLAASPVPNSESDSNATTHVEDVASSSVAPPLLISPMPGTQDDFQEIRSGIRPTKAKRKLSSSPSPKKSSKKTATDISSDEDEGMTCPICFEPWTTSGKHRLVSLKCGHLFGQRCVERWLKDCHQKCPQCNAKAKRLDVRVIYAKKLKAIDTSDLEQAIKAADKAKTERRDRELELAKVRLQYTMAMEECNRLKSQMKNMTTVAEDRSDKKFGNSSSAEASGSMKKLYNCVKSIVIHSGGGCRIMDFDQKGMNFAISQPSPHANFMSGFGVKKLSAMDLKSGYFTLLHQKAIKDLKFSPHAENLLLSAALDGSLRITDLVGNTKVHEYKVRRPLWSCCWDSTDRNLIYTGLSTGGYIQYDLRNTSEALSTLENTSSRCPVVSLYHVPPLATDSFHCRGGLFSGTLEGALFWQNVEGPSEISNFKPTILPLEPGSCTGLQYCRETHHCLVTYRPGRNHPKTTHILSELQTSSGSDVTCNVITNFTGGTRHSMLTRNALFSLPKDDSATSDPQLIACVGDEVKRQLHVYNASKCGLVQSLSSDDGPPLDVVPVHMPSRNPMLAMLSQSTLKVYALQ